MDRIFPRARRPPSLLDPETRPGLIHLKGARQWHRARSPSYKDKDGIASQGWRDFDVQGTFGASLPAGTWQRLGTPLALNAAFQYHVLGKFWPEVEVNSTAWPNGTLDGKKETFLTPGVVAGRFPFRGRVGVVVGTGMQIAATHFHRSNHNLILTVRFPF